MNNYYNMDISRSSFSGISPLILIYIGKIEKNPYLIGAQVKPV